MSNQNNFSLQYRYNIKQASNGNKEKYQLGGFKLIQYQILLSDIVRIVWQQLYTVRRTSNKILGVTAFKL